MAGPFLVVTVVGKKLGWGTNKRRLGATFRLGLAKVMSIRGALLQEALLRAFNC